MPRICLGLLLVGIALSVQCAAAHLTDAWFYALDYLRRHPADAAARVAPREDLTADKYLASLRGAQILDREENLRWLTGQAPPLDDHLASLADVMLRTGRLAAPVQAGSIAVGRFIQ